ncbi:MAG: chitobiase/beta-hexosaminidase C-terminal domain-containing protein [Paludibacteraceae bacterium]|nr:chitobiase/beta-hexosaminidase C-terminal domain-containing protein [Paludibacteraceae bacterium]
MVNHRAGNGWCDGFKTDNFGEYGVFTLKASHITKDDEASGQSACSGKLSDYNGWNFDKPIEYWGGYKAARDLAHILTEVRDAVKAYLKWMKNVIGYDGFRWDVVKGFNPAYIKEYTQAAEAYLSVGEHYSVNYNDLKGWVEATDKTALVFDFGFKNAIFQWGVGSDYSKLGWMDGSILRPAGLVHNPGMRQYAVTFVDNHDTSSPHPDGFGWEYKGDKAKANAIMLAAPGIPCVFWRDWVAVKADIKKMIAARKKVGLNSNSDVRITNTSGYYESHGVGTTGELICRVGSWNGTPSGFTLECSGTGWAYYTKGGSTAPTITVSPQGGYVGVNGKVTITASTGSTIYYTTNGTNPTSSSTQYTGQITITTNNTRIKAIAIKGAESSAIADYTFLTEQPAGGDYYVAGNLELCGVAWGVSAAANKMTKVGSIWEKTYTNVPVGTHMYKVTDGTWNAPSPWNQQGTASLEGTHEEIILTQTSTVTIKFDGTKVLVPVVTGIRDAEFDASVVAVSGTIFVSDQDFSVFNLTGVNVTEQNGNLPNGVYVVRLANGAAKVVGLR